MFPLTPLGIQQGQPGSRYRATDTRSGFFWQSHFGSPLRVTASIHTCGKSRVAPRVKRRVQTPLSSLCEASLVLT